MRQVLADVTPRTIILTPDGRAGFYAWRYRADDGRTMGRVLVQERPGETTAVDVDIEQPVDVVYCDRQAQEALWARLCTAQRDECGAPLARTDDGRYALADGGAVWLDAGELALRVERGADGVKIGAFGRGETDTGRLPLRALHFLPGEVAG